MTNEDLERLKSLADAATPGPWGHHWEGFCIVRGTRKVTIGQCVKTVDEDYIAAMSPDVCLALIAELRAKDARIAELEAHYRDLHPDGCEYGDDCPLWVNTNHYECRACRTRRFLDPSEIDRERARHA